MQKLEEKFFSDIEILNKQRMDIQSRLPTYSECFAVPLFVNKSIRCDIDIIFYKRVGEILNGYLKEIDDVNFTFLGVDWNAYENVGEKGIIAYGRYLYMQRKKENYNCKNCNKFNLCAETFSENKNLSEKEKLEVCNAIIGTHWCYFEPLNS